MLLTKSATPPCTRAERLFKRHQQIVYKHTDRIFAILFPAQWIVGVVAAYLLTQRGWSNNQTSLRGAILLGAVISAWPTTLALLRPGATTTRYVVSINQMLLSGLLAHLSGGRTEAYFHVFGSFALLALYRDWRVIVTATAVTILEHLLRGWLFPLPVYGILTAPEWRWLEHAGWVLLLDLALFAVCRQSTSEMWQIAEHHAALDASEERYRAVVEQTTEGIFLLETENFRVIECNEAFYQLLGCADADEAKTLTVPDFLVADEREIAGMKEMVRAKKRAMRAETKYRRRDGSLINVEISGSTISFNDTKPYCVNVKDITARKRIEAELKQLALVAQKTRNSVILTDELGYIQWVNEAFTRMSGYKLNEVLGENPIRLLRGENSSGAAIAEILRAFREQRPFEGELCNRTKEGRNYWVSASIVPIKSATGQLQGYISVEADITERKAIEEKLRHAYDNLEQRVVERTAELAQANQAMQIEATERKKAQLELSEARQFLHQVIDNLPSLIFVKDGQGKYIVANRALAEIYQTTSENIIGKLDSELNRNTAEAVRFWHSDHEVLTPLEEKIIPDEKITDAAGNAHWFQTILRPLAIGKKPHLLGISTDLTDRKIMESQLRHAQKMESIGQLAAGIAHEINTPTQYVGDNTRFIRDAFTDLSGVLEKYGELLAVARNGVAPPALIAEIDDESAHADLEYLSEEIPKAIQQSLEGVSRIAKIVQSMKDFAHPGTKEKQAADINKAIESTVIVASNEWKYVAELEMRLDDRLPPVPCLLGEFNQVILNLVTNATHAIADVIGDGTNGKGKITITTEKVSMDGVQFLTKVVAEVGFVIRWTCPK